MTPHGYFHWNELMTRDAERTKAFYAETLGWTFESAGMPDGSYWVAKMGENHIAGIFDMSGPGFEGMDPHWITYVSVDNLDARLNRAVSMGARVLREPFDVPEVARIVILQEPEGAVIGWMQLVPQQGGQPA